MVDLFTNFFWETATALVNVILPVLALFLVFRLVHDLLYRERL